MKRLFFALLVSGALAVSAPALSERLLAEGQQPRVEGSRPARVASHAPTAPAFGAAEQNAMVKQYCIGCHSDRGKAGQLTLQSFDAAASANPDQIVTTEKMIRKLRAGMMPPATARRPAPEQIAALASALETRIDRVAMLNPNPGSRPFQRMNRSEYARAVKDILH